MSERPEGTSGGYGDQDDPYDQDAWQEFTPWRPGDPSTRGEAPQSYAAAYDAAGTYRARLAANEQRDGPRSVQRADDAQAEEQPRRRWWTEENPRKIASGDRVKNVTASGGNLVSHVPAGTEGRVTGTRSAMFGGEYATVDFANGYTEEVSTVDLRRETGWF